MGLMSCSRLFLLSKIVSDTVLLYLAKWLLFVWVEECEMFGSETEKRHRTMMGRFKSFSDTHCRASQEHVLCVTLGHTCVKR